MTTSLAPTNDSVADLKRVAEKLLGVSGVTLETIDGGRNSRVYRLAALSGVYALKTYFRHAADSRARMETEFQALQFLWDNGECAVPEPITASAEDDCAIYEWIDGERIAEPSVEQIDGATAFLARLHRLRTRPGIDRLRSASEACFSARALVDCLHGRLEPLVALTEYPELSAFLREQLCPALEGICDFSRLSLRDLYDRDLDPEHRTLSPSDFGFHNALLRRGGGLVFLDLEYFGWDDPVKLISDFLLHPGMSLSSAAKQRYAAVMLREFPEAAARFESVYPMYGLKWCLILLNEFLPAHLARRKFAGLTDREIETRQSEQLIKARNMLRQAADASLNPYGDQDRTN